MSDLIAAQPGNTGEVLSLDGVTVWLSGRTVLDDVSFSLHQGQLAGLIGSNGAGKTTILRVILGLQSVASGLVNIRPGFRPGKPGGIGYVPQKVVIGKDVPLRARDLVGLGLDGARAGFPFPSRAKRLAADQMLEAVGMTGFANARVGSLSGGELQRVLIAHSLVSKPSLLLLDEPLANLDIASEQDVVALLSRLCREQEIAVLVTAHDVNPLLSVMDRVIYVARGNVASGTTGEVIRQDVLSALYGHHVDVLRVHNRILVVAEAGLEPQSGDTERQFGAQGDSGAPGEAGSTGPDANG